MIFRNSYGIKILTDFSSVLSQFTCLTDGQTERQTDGQTEFLRLQAKIDRKSPILLERGQFNPKFQVEGVAPPIIFARIVRPINALQLCRRYFS